MNRQAIEDFLTTNGWLKDIYGHYKRNFETTRGTLTRRIKMQATSCRIEVSCHHEATEYSKATNDRVQAGEASPATPG